MSAHSIRRVQRIIDSWSSKNYLEVGVDHGNTFLHIKAPNKIAVDPHFKFEFGGSNPPEGSFFQVTSDEYWNSIDHRVMFDVVFLDGLHTFEQTYRDFCATLAHTTVDSVIIIDDTFPNDVFSSLNDSNDTVRFRKMHSSDNNDHSWHGDVFKVVLAIHDFHPTLDYRTIFGGGNPQTVIWRSKENNRKPRFESFDQISRCNWFDLHKSQDLMNITDEEQCFLDLENSRCR